MVKKFVYGTPFETEAVVKEIPSSEGNPDYGTFSTENGFSFTTKLADEDMVFGLGEATAASTNAVFFTSVTALMIQTT